MVDVDSLRFDNFSRTNRDIVCVHPIPTLIRLEEEITIVKKLRKIEEKDTGLQCPLPSQPLINHPENLNNSVIKIKEETDDVDKTSQDKFYLVE